MSFVLKKHAKQKLIKNPINFDIYGLNDKDFWRIKFEG